MTTDTLNSKTDPMKVVINTLSVIGVMFVFLVSLKMMGGSFKLFGKDAAHEIINYTSNPFVSLFIGLLATAIINSSSTTTSMVVAMVAAGTLTIENAVPMIMGANIGTSVTSSIVAIGHIADRKEYKKAMSAATVHDFFNIMVVLILFPLEYYFGFLSGLAGSLANLFTAGSGDSDKMFSILGVTVKPAAKFIMELLNKNAWLCLLVALVMLFFSLHSLTKILKKLLIGRAEEKMDKLVFNKPLKALGWGTLLTTLVQSSSVTTSLIVPMVASNKVSLRKAFPFLMGANIGTTITALIAAMSTDASVFKASLTIALAHVLFNVLGATLLFPIKILREIPIKLSRNLGKATAKNKLIGIVYIAVTFFLTPFLLILVSGAGSSKNVITEYKLIKTDLKSNTTFFTVFEDKIDESNGGVERSVFENLTDSNNYDVSNPTFKINANRDGQIVNIGTDLYMISPVAYCFDRTELQGKVELCVKEILPNYQLNKNYIADTCLVYHKRFYNAEVLDSVYEKLYLDINKILIIKREVYSKTNELILKEEVK